MAADSKAELTTQVEAALWDKVKGVAKLEGVPIQDLVEEALLDFLEKYGGSKPRSHVAAAYEASVGKYEALYKKLAE